MLDHPMSHEANYVRSWVSPLVLGLLAVSPAFADEPSVMVLEGTTAAPYDNGKFTVFDPARAWDLAKREAWSNTAGPGEKAPLEALGVIAQAPIGPDGTFRLEVTVDKPRRAYFAVLDAMTPEGGRLGAVKMGNNFILEAGELKLQMIRGDYSVITGGYYNDAVFNSWRLSDEYKAAQSEYERLRAPVRDEPEQAKRRRLDRVGEVYNTVMQLESRGRSEVALTHPDPLARRLTIESAWLGGPWQQEAIRALAELTPEDRWVVERLAGMQAAQKNAGQNRQLRVGESILDFTGETLDGEIVQMADVRAESRYVLMEFWASWCGPCRVEIPHMKEAYERFRDKGFEIVSFTIDDEREDWEEASAEEDMPWIDLGMGPEAAAPKAYNVTGVPNNYLVDSKTGKIVAKDLRRHKLDEKLEELLP